jgi:hypothetical protein
MAVACLKNSKPTAYVTVTISMISKLDLIMIGGGLARFPDQPDIPRTETNLSHDPEIGTG